MSYNHVAEMFDSQGLQWLINVDGETLVADSPTDMSVNKRMAELYLPNLTEEEVGAANGVLLRERQVLG
jgi:hypothetical protein